jgi:hypothetical protein
MSNRRSARGEIFFLLPGRCERDPPIPRSNSVATLRHCFSWRWEPAEGPDRLFVLRGGANLSDSGALIVDRAVAKDVGIVMFPLEGAVIGGNDAFLNIAPCTREDLTPGRVRWRNLTPRIPLARP